MQLLVFLATLFFLTLLFLFLFQPHRHLLPGLLGQGFRSSATCTSWVRTSTSPSAVSPSDMVPYSLSTWVLSLASLLPRLTSLSNFFKPTSSVSVLALKSLPSNASLTSLLWPLHRTELTGKFNKKLSMSELLGARCINNFMALRAQKYYSLIGLLAQKARDCEHVNLTEELLKLTNNVISRMMLGEAED